MNCNSVNYFVEFDYQERMATKVTQQPIEKLLNALRMDSVFLTYSQLGHPWGITFPVMDNCMMFHMVLSGSLKLTIGKQTTDLTSGDFVLLPKGEVHSLADTLGHTCTPLEKLPIKCLTERYETLMFGGDGQETQLLCGAISVRHPLALKLISIMPPELTICHDEDSFASVVSPLIDIIRQETQNMNLAAEAIISRCADIMVITAIRKYLQQADESSISWLNALNDDRIGAAVQLIHDHPDKHWSLNDLAQQVAMSRTSFAQQFKQLIGAPPMDYLTEWRMSLAYSKLQNSKAPIISIALDVGYQSESAFSRAFKKVIGRNPSEVRRMHALTN